MVPNAVLAAGIPVEAPAAVVLAVSVLLTAGWLYLFFR